MRWRLAQSCKRGKNVKTNVCLGLYRQVRAMRKAANSVKTLLRAASFLILLFAIAAHGQDKDADAKAKAGNDSKDVRLTIVVTGGDEKKPVDSASVYVRYVEQRKISKDKKIEMNLKTNQSGVCHVPVVPPGKFVVQVIADGWKTYGEYYDLNQSEQTININLARPPKWY
jgi:hypothetical protein